MSCSQNIVPACKYKDIGVHEHLTGTFPTLSLPSCSHPQHSKQLELRDCLALLTRAVFSCLVEQTIGVQEFMFGCFTNQRHEEHVTRDME
jgi:hypothetical protein